MRPQGTRNAPTFRTPAIERTESLAAKLSTSAMWAARLMLKASALAGAELTIELKELCISADPDEARLMADILAHRESAAAGFERDPRRNLNTRRIRCSFGLEDANMAKIEATGERLRTTTEYNRYRRQGSPSLSTIIEEFGSWRKALYEVGLLDRSIARTLVTRPQGRAASRPDLDEEQRVALLAAAVEMHDGRWISHDAWDDIRDVISPGLPFAKNIGIAGGWKEAERRVYEFIREQGPLNFPKTHDYLDRCKRAEVSLAGGES